MLPAWKPTEWDITQTRQNSDTKHSWLSSLIIFSFVSVSFCGLSKRKEKVRTQMHLFYLPRSTGQVDPKILAVWQPWIQIFFKNIYFTFIIFCFFWSGGIFHENRLQAVYVLVQEFRGVKKYMYCTYCRFFFSAFITDVNYMQIFAILWAILVPIPRSLRGPLYIVSIFYKCIYHIKHIYRLMVHVEKVCGFGVFTQKGHILFKTEFQSD